MDTHEARIYYTLVIESTVLIFLIGFFIGITMWWQRKMKLSYKDKIFTESMVAENERARIAADLHDELGSSLAAIKLHLECLEPTNSREKEGIATTEKYIDTAMVKIREISNNLTPKTLQHNTIVIAAREFCETTCRKARIHLRFKANRTEYSIEKSNEIHLYRIVQEIITNAVKHAKPKHISVSWTVNKDLLTISIADDGKGFDKSLVQSNVGSGLHNIVNRVHLLHGTIYLDTAPGLGTDYTIEIPV